MDVGTHEQDGEAVEAGAYYPPEHPDPVTFEMDAAAMDALMADMPPDDDYM
jgi:hypothetical protein